MTGTDVRALRDDQIGIELKTLRAKLFALRSQAVTEKVEDTGQFRTIKKDVARLLTERNSRRLAKEKAAKEKAAKEKAAKERSAKA